jgi:O-antigen ligase
MSYIHYPRRLSISRDRLFRWIIFLFIALTLFLSAHNFSDFPRPVGDYNRPQDEIVANAEGGNASREISLFVLAAAAILSFASYKSQIHLRADAVTSRILIAFAIWCALSLFWADDSMIAFKRLIAFAIFCALSLAIVRMFSIAEIIQWSFFATATFLIIAITAELAVGSFRPWLSDYRFSGMQTPNDEGIECGLLCLSGIAMANLYSSSRRLYLISSAVGAIFLLLTVSRTSLVASVLALLVYFTFSGSRSRKKLILSGLLVVAASFVFLAGAGLLSGVKNALSLKRDEDVSVDSFAGRTEIWQDVSRYIIEKPLIGHGYGAFWTPARIAEISDLEQWGVPDGHSVYIDYLLTLGAVGLILYLLCIGQGFRKAFQLSKTARNCEAGFLGAVLLFGFVDGFFESSIGEGTFLTLLCTVSLMWMTFNSAENGPIYLPANQVSPEAGKLFT